MRWKCPCYTHPHVDGAWAWYWRGWLTITFGCLAQRASDFVSQELMLRVIRHLSGWWLIRHHHRCSILDSGDGYWGAPRTGDKRAEPSVGCFFGCMFFLACIHKLVFPPRYVYKRGAGNTRNMTIWQFVNYSRIACGIVPLTCCLRWWCRYFHLSHTHPCRKKTKENPGVQDIFYHAFIQ